jgi:hypothetical protein
MGRSNREDCRARSMERMEHWKALRYEIEHGYPPPSCRDSSKHCRGCVTLTVRHVERQHAPGARSRTGLLNLPSPAAAPAAALKLDSAGSPEAKAPDAPESCARPRKSCAAKADSAVPSSRPMAMKPKRSSLRSVRRLRRSRKCIDDVLYLLLIEAKHAHRGHDSAASELRRIGQKLY